MLRFVRAAALVLIVGTTRVSGAADNSPSNAAAVARYIPSTAFVCIRESFQHAAEVPELRAYHDTYLLKRLQFMFGENARDIDERLIIYSDIEYTTKRTSATGKNVIIPETDIAVISIFKSRRPLDQQAVRRTLGGANVSTFEGNELFVTENRNDGDHDWRAPTLFFPDDRTVMFGSFHGITRCLADIKKSAASDCREALEKCSPDADLAVVFAPGAMRGYAERKLTIDPFLPPYAFAKVLLDGLKVATLETHAVPDCRSKLVITPTENMTPQRYSTTLDQFRPIILGWLDDFGKSLQTVLPSPVDKTAQSAFAKFQSALRSAKREVTRDRIVLSLDSKDQLAVFDAVYVPQILAGATERRLLDESQPMKEIAFGASAESINFRKIKTAICDKAGNPLLSWRVALLQFTESSELYNEFHRDEPWDSPHNKELIDKMPKMYQTPQATAAGETTICLVVGKGTLFTNGEDLSFAAIEGGASKPAILIVRGGPDAATIWTKPDSFAYDSRNPRAVFNGLTDKAYLVGLNSGRAAWIPSSISDAELSELFAGTFTKPLPALSSLAWPDYDRYFSSSLYEPSKQKMQLIVNQLTESGQFIAPAIYSKDGKPLLSWRVRALPQLGYKELYDKFDLSQPWDSPHNKPLVAQIPDIYHRDGRKTRDGKTSFVLPVGSETLFHPNRAGPTEAELREGDKFVSTIALLEVDDDAAVPWTKPDDLSYDPMSPRQHLCGNYPVGFLAAFPNHRPAVIPAWVDDDYLRALFTWNGHEPIDLNDIEHKLP